MAPLSILLSLLLIKVIGLRLREAGFTLGNINTGIKSMIYINLPLFLINAGLVFTTAKKDLDEVKYGDKMDLWTFIYIWILVGSIDELIHRGFLQGTLLEGKYLYFSSATILSSIIVVLVIGFSFQISNSLLCPIIIIHNLIDKFNLSVLTYRKQQVKARKGGEIMKKIGLIGGMSWESSLEYYRIINQLVKEKLGEPHSAECVMYSVDFAEYEKLQHAGKWDELTKKMVEIGKKLEVIGSDFVLICTNTMHKMAPQVQKNLNIPLLHIADAAAEEIKSRGLKKVGLLGTKFTMEEDFYKKRIKEKYDIDVIIPEEKERDIIHQVIYKELISGIINESSKEKFQNIIKDLRNRGALGVILGCTEIPLLIKEKDSVIPVFDTTMLHAKKAVKLALKEE